MTAEDYAANLQANIEALAQRLKAQRYRAKWVRRPEWLDLDDVVHDSLDLVGLIVSTVPISSPVAGLKDSSCPSAPILFATAEK